jgi:acyl carrier protein
MNASKSEVFEKLQGIMHELFEINPEDIKGSSSLYYDLDLDSIDAVDLIAHLQNITGRKFKPEEFKTVKVVDDVVEIIAAQLVK